MEIKKCTCKNGEFKVKSYLTDIATGDNYHVAVCDCCCKTIRYIKECDPQGNLTGRIIEYNR
jgi:hypothetical protein